MRDLRPHGRGKIGEKHLFRGKRKKEWDEKLWRKETGRGTMT